MNKANKYRTFLFFYTICLIVATALIAYFEIEHDFLKKHFFKKKPEYPYSYKKCESAANLDHKNILYMKYLIPCKDKQHDKLLSRRLPKIKHKINTGITPAMKEMVEAGNLTAFKKEFLKIINRDMDVPVKEVYFEEFHRVKTGSGLLP